MDSASIGRFNPMWPLYHRGRGVQLNAPTSTETASPGKRHALLCFLALASLCCGRPVPPPATACPACECPEVHVAPAAVAAPDAEEARADVAAVAPPREASVPAHLRPSEAQCRVACARIMKTEIKQLEGRMKRVEPALAAALQEGLSAEAERLTAGCVDTCAERFTTATTTCLTRFEDDARVRSCILNAAVAMDGVER